MHQSDTPFPHAASICLSLLLLSSSSTEYPGSMSHPALITDIYGVREKGGVAENTVPNPHTMKN